MGTQPIAGPSSATRDDPPEASVPRPPPAAETMRLYKTDWTAFATWCEATGVAAPTQRGEHLRLTAKHGRMGWQKAPATAIAHWWRPISVGTSG